MSESKLNTSITTIQDRGTIATDPMRVFRFKATFLPAEGGTIFNDSVTSFSGGFSGIGGLRTDLSIIEYREGGYNTTTHKIPGMASFEPVRFSRGVLFSNDGAINWMRGLFAATAGEGLAVGPGKTFRCNVKIELMDHPNAGPTASNAPRLAFFLHNAWIASLNYSDLSAGANELMFETMTLVHEGLSVAFLDADNKVTAGSAKPSWG